MARVTAVQEPVFACRVEDGAETSINKKSREDAHPAMTAAQYLQNQAEHCRRAADDAADPFVAEQLRRLAADFERRARAELRPAEPVQHDRAA